MPCVISLREKAEPKYLLTTADSKGNLLLFMATSFAFRFNLHHPTATAVFRRSSLPRGFQWRCFLALVLGILGGVVLPSTRAELVYDNSTNNRSIYVALTEEFGDEVDLAGSARVLSAMTFSVVGETSMPTNTSARFRIYKNNGPILPIEGIRIPSPGELLYESGDIPIEVGVHSLRITDIAVPVPESFTWTVRFRGAGTEPGTRAGLEVYHPPTVGSSFRDYWVRAEDGFQLQLLDGGASASFAARFEAIPDPPVTLTAELFPEGTVVRVSGPIGTDQILETSQDGLHWRTLAVIRLATVSSGSYLDTTANDGREHRYRTRTSPNPGATVILQGIRRSTNDVVSVTFSGPRNTSHYLEVSDDRVNWKIVDVLYLFSGSATYQEPLGAGLNRYYRTSHPTGRGPVYLIRGIRRDPDGAVVVACSGQPSLEAATVEASADFVNWSPVGTILFTSPRAEFRDPEAATHPARIYRIRR